MKDRWKWKHNLLVVLGVFVGLPAFGLVVYFGWEALPKAVTPESELWGISLGMPKKEVAFRKGPPRDSTATMWVFKLGAARPEEYGPVVFVHFERDSVNWIETDRGKTGSSTPPSVAWLSGYESEEEVIRKLGKPTDVGITYELRTLSFAQRRVFVELHRNRIIGFGLYRPRGPRDAFSFIR